MIRDECALTPDALRWRCDDAALGFRTTDELEPEAGIIGQDRAAEAIQLSLAVRGPGYNAYVAGMSGSGRLTTLRRLLEGLRHEDVQLSDKCYVYNFAQPDRPRLLVLPAGKGCQLRSDLEELVKSLRTDLNQVFESDDFQARAKSIMQEGAERKATLLRDLEEELQRHGFQLVPIQMGPYVRPEVVPVVNDQPITFDDLEEKLNSGEVKGVDIDELRRKHAEFRERLVSVMKEAARVERETAQRQVQLEQEFAQWAIMPMIDTIAERYKSEQVRAYLQQVREQVLGELDRFRKSDQAQQQQLPFMAEDEFTEYRVNVLVDNSEQQGPPVIVETVPTFQNLFGTLEASMERFGRVSTDHTRIRAGSLIRADGGYLVFDLVDAITEYGVWKMLKRCLITRQLRIYSEGGPSMISIVGLKPEPVPLDVKVCVIGNRELYSLLYEWDDDFRRVFKIKADFDYEMDNSDEHVGRIARYVRRIVEEEGLPPWAASGVAALIEEGARRAGRQKKITTRFGGLADLIREATYYARQAGAATVERSHVETALHKKVQRINLVETKIREAIEDDLLHIETEGAVAGQVNGLAVLSVGDYMFGRPARVTAKTGVGQGGVIQLDREAKLSGATHDKGVLILQGFLRSMYARTRSITLSASLCFEQSYAGIDGDSASTTELFALLSSLSGVPIDQGIAVTGSMDQHGRVQAIGGVNQKIEGFYDTCVERGLTGTQGCIIPAANVSDLMLRSDVVDAVREGKFHVWAISHVDEGIEILTGLPAGARAADGTLPAESVHGKVETALLEIADAIRRESREERDKDKAGAKAKENEKQAAEEEPEDPTRDRPPGEEPPPERRGRGPTG